MIDLSIVIISFNTKYYVRKCLESLLEFKPKDLKLEVIVVDNDSKDGSLEDIELLKKQFVKKDIAFELIANGANLGFSKANNVGIKKTHGRYVLFLNSDTEIYKNTLEEMVTFMDLHQDAGAATCFVELVNKQLDDAAHRGFPTPWNALCHFSGISKIFPASNFFNGYHMGWKDLDKVHEIDALAGAFMIVRREAGEQVKWWDEDYFFYGEDIDFCYQLKQNGWKIYFVPTTKVRHYKGVSSGIKKETQQLSTADKKSKRMITNARFDAMKIFYRKNYYKKYPRYLTNFILFGVELKRQITLQKYR